MNEIKSILPAKIGTTEITGDGLTIEINPIPRGKLLIGKRPEGGILTCDRCGRREANVERNENGWELWSGLSLSSSTSDAGKSSNDGRVSPRSTDLRFLEKTLLSATSSFQARRAVTTACAARLTTRRGLCALKIRSTADFSASSHFSK
ncbi:MAG TPA: hypothetical protein VFE60_14185 [Roseiarcus sp.]|jgi:hypothetical protein|nr:hypothetical protein [Roseiarcus sp.]